MTMWAIHYQIRGEIAQLMDDTIYKIVRELHYSNKKWNMKQ